MTQTLRFSIREAATVVLAMWNVAGSVAAQVVPDATLPSNSVVSLDDNTFVIEGGTAVNGNLFHSFEQFSIPTDGGALFNNGVGIENIFSRVTGSSISEIDGVLGANGTANLFFLNPNGIVFGPNARLELGGSFVASTADSVVFENGVEFSASSPQMESLLVVDIPVGLRLRDTPGSIVNRSRAESSDGSGFGLQVPPGEMLALVGGDIALDSGKLESFGGNIILGGLRESGSIELNSDISLIFPETLKYSDIQIQEFAGVDVRGAGGGNISIYGNNINILESSFLSAGIAAGSGSTESHSGDISIEAQGTVVLDNESLINHEIEIEGVGQSGNIEINANQIQLTNGSQITNKTSGEGNAGQVLLSADRSILLDGLGSRSEFPSAIFNYVGETGVGNAGNIYLTANDIRLTHGAFLNSTTQGQGNGGNIRLEANGEIFFGKSILDTPYSYVSSIISFSLQDTIGNTGNIELIGDRVHLSDGAIVSSEIRGVGNAGDIRIEAREVNIEQTSLRTFTRSAGFEFLDDIIRDLTFYEGAIGDAGNIQIEADSIFLRNAELNVSSGSQGNAGSVIINGGELISIEESLILSSLGSRDTLMVTPVDGAEMLPIPIGNAGEINLSANNIFLNQSSLQSLTLGEGSAANINLTAQDTVSISGIVGLNTQIGNIVTTVGQDSTGQGGNVVIEAGTILFDDRGQISTFSRGIGDAGSVTLDAQFDIIMRGNPIISSDFLGAEGLGGDISFLAGNLIVLDGVKIGTGVNENRTIEEIISNIDGLISRTERIVPSRGNGGNITISARELEILNGSNVNTSTNSIGNSGVIFFDIENLITIAGTDLEGFPSRVSSSVGETASGNSTFIQIDTEDMIIANGGEIITSTFGQGNAGKININISDSLTVNGLTIPSVPEPTTELREVTTNVNNVAESIGGIRDVEDSIYITTVESNLSGSIEALPSRIVSQVEPEASGQGGRIDVVANRLFLHNTGQISTSSEGDGGAGDISIRSESLRMDEEALLSSETIFGNSLEEGNGAIEIDSQDLVLRDRTRITTNAFNNATGGDINIDTGVLVAIDNSDITTNADAGNAGIITITADGILGSQLRTRDELIEALGENLTVESPSELLTSDITAISVRDAELNGQTLFNTPDVDSTQGIAELPETVVDPDELLSQNPCVQSQSSEFTDIGRGGFLASPDELPNTIELEADWIEVVTEESSNSAISTSPPDTSESAETLVPARGWRLDETGRVVLTADDRSQNHVESSFSSISIDRTQFSYRCSPN